MSGVVSLHLRLEHTLSSCLLSNVHHPLLCPFHHCSSLKRQSLPFDALKTIPSWYLIGPTDLPELLIVCFLDVSEICLAPAPFLESCELLFFDASTQPGSSQMKLRDSIIHRGQVGCGIDDRVASMLVVVGVIACDCGDIVLCGVLPVSHGFASMVALSLFHSLVTPGGLSPRRRRRHGVGGDVENVDGLEMDLRVSTYLYSTSEGR
jgi:hypothetical protein